MGDLAAAFAQHEITPKIIPNPPKEQLSVSLRKKFENKERNLAGLGWNPSDTRNDAGREKFEKCPQIQFEGCRPREHFLDGHDW